MKGLTIMQDIARSIDFSKKQIQLYEINEGMGCLKYDNHTIYNIISHARIVLP